jgi:hypothetical protein
MAQKYEYVYAGDELDDDNNGLVYGVRDYDQDNPCGVSYCEWFPSLGQLEANTRKHDLNVTNRKEFLNRFKVKG